MQLIKTDAKNQDFIDLVKELDADLAVSDGEDHAFYNQFNKIDMIKYVIVVYIEGKAIGCGAIKEYDSSTMEIKRMFTKPAGRGKGVASAILIALEEWARELSYPRCILETGINQPMAISLYKKTGFTIIPNYGQYEHVKNSFCFEKIL